MLLCPKCHKHVDDRPHEYPVDVLIKYKRDHEQRIMRITALDKRYETKVVIVKARIGGHVVEIASDDVIDAIAPYYPDCSNFFEVDLTKIDVSDDVFYSVAQQTIQNRINVLLNHGAPPSHLSVFALAPIPVLMFLGNVLSNKIAVEFFQRHRDTCTWTWKEHTDGAQFMSTQVRDGNDTQRVALALSISGHADRESIYKLVDSTVPIYEIVVVGQSPTLDLLNNKSDLMSFRALYRSFMGQIRTKYKALQELLVFPAIPAPIALACGHDLLPKVDPVLKVYDYDKRNGGFRYALNIN